MISSSEEPGMKKQKQKKKNQQNLREDLEKLLCFNQKSCLESVRLFSTQTGKREFLSLQQKVLTWYKQNVMLICGEGNGTPLQYFAWKIPWMEELGRLQSMGSLRVGHDWVTSLSLFTFMHWRRKWQPTPVFLPGESQGRGSLVAAVCRITQSWTRLKWLSSSSSNVNMNFSREKIHSFHHILKEFYRPEKNKIKDGKQLV